MRTVYIGDTSTKPDITYNIIKDVTKAAQITFGDDQFGLHTDLDTALAALRQNKVTEKEVAQSMLDLIENTRSQDGFDPTFSANLAAIIIRYREQLTQFVDVKDYNELHQALIQKLNELESDAKENQDDKTLQHINTLRTFIPKDESNTSHDEKVKHFFSQLQSTQDMLTTMARRENPAMAKPSPLLLLLNAFFNDTVNSQNQYLHKAYTKAYGAALPEPPQAAA